MHQSQKDFKLTKKMQSVQSWPTINWKIHINRFTIQFAAFFSHLFTSSYSQGTTAFLVFTSTRPEYNARLNDVHLMAPVGYLQGLTQPLMKLASSFYKPLKRLAGLFRLYKLTIDTRFLPKVLRLLCVNDRPPQQNICKVILNAFAGPNYINIVSDNFISFISFKQNEQQINKYDDSN